MNSRFPQCPTCGRMLIDHYMEFKKMGVISYGADHVAEPESLIENTETLKLSPTSRVGKFSKKVTTYINKHDLRMCCVMRLMGASNIDSDLSRIINFGNDGEIKPMRN